MRKASVVCGAVSSRLSLAGVRSNKFCAAVFCAALVLFFTVLGASAQQSAHLPSTTRLTVATDQATGQATLTVKVIGGDRGVPTGAVTLANGTSSLGSVMLDEDGTATLSTAVASSQRVTAVYEGDTSFGPSSSLTLAVPAASTVPTFTLSATPTTLTVKAGNYVTTTVTITPANGFIDPVLLSCTGLPANSTCTFNPTIVTPNGTVPATTAASATLTIQTLAATTAGALRPGQSPGSTGRRGLYAIALPGLAALCGLCLVRRRAFGAMRSIGMVALLAFSVFAAGLGLSACSPRYSYFHHPPILGPGTTLGTFTVLVNGSSANAGTVIIPPAVPIVLTVN